jgi:hypothetical protein
MGAIAAILGLFRFSQPRLEWQNVAHRFRFPRSTPLIRPAFRDA